MYDLVEKKLVKSHDMQFMEDQTIEDIDKVKKFTPEKDNNLSEIDPVRMPVHDLDIVDNNVQNGEQHNYGDQLLGNGFDIPLDDDAEEEQEMSQDENLGDAPEPPLVQIRRSNRQRQSSTRYISDEYLTLIDGEEPECYYESIESEDRQKTCQSKLQKYVVLSTTKAELDFFQDEHWFFYDSQSAIHFGIIGYVMLELAKVHIDDNGANMMSKAVPRGKFESCEIAELAITST
ncbi:hypothetical protein CR513_44402, partial [Mucuna pruriens]